VNSRESMAVNFTKTFVAEFFIRHRHRGGFRIIRTGPIFDSVGKSINATLFLRSLKEVVVRYVDDLQSQQMHVDAWTKALRKVKFICDASRT
jgi:hypothetical protein